MKTQHLEKFDFMPMKGKSKASKGEDQFLLEADCIPLTATESQQTYGGVDKSTLSFWDNLVFIGGSIAQSVIVFSTQGGRNAGLSVR